MLYYVVSLLSQIYCDGPILQAVQEARLYPDSKYFVDMPLKQDPGYRSFYLIRSNVIIIIICFIYPASLFQFTFTYLVTTLRDFYELGDTLKDPKLLQDFVNTHFDDPGHELIEANILKYFLKYNPATIILKCVSNATRQRPAEALPYQTTH